MSQVYITYYFSDSKESKNRRVDFFGTYESMEEAIAVVKSKAEEAYDSYIGNELIELANDGNVNPDLEIHMSDDNYVFKFNRGRENYCVKKDKFIPQKK